MLSVLSLTTEAFSLPAKLSSSLVNSWCNDDSMSGLRLGRTPARYCSLMLFLLIVAAVQLSVAMLDAFVDACFQEKKSTHVGQLVEQSVFSLF